VRALTAAEVLSTWERSTGHPPLRQALELLAQAAPERSLDEWAELPYGQFCRGLFQLRALMFGPVMPGVVSCPRCGERLEFSFECRLVENGPAAPTGPVRFDFQERAVEMRLPAAADLLEARSADELFSCCTTGAVEPNQALIRAASECVTDADPLSETVLDLVCAACGHPWQAFLDIAGYLRSEIAHEARRLLGEVHTLASAYGWPEDAILALSPPRRGAYLELAEL